MLSTQEKRRAWRARYEEAKLQGKSAAVVASSLSVSASTVYGWWARFRQEDAVQSGQKSMAGVGLERARKIKAETFSFRRRSFARVKIKAEPANVSVFGAVKVDFGGEVTMQVFSAPAARIAGTIIRAVLAEEGR